MIRRPPRSTLDRSSAASDVYKRQIIAYNEFHNCCAYSVYTIGMNDVKFKCNKFYGSAKFIVNNSSITPQIYFGNEWLGWPIGTHNLHPAPFDAQCVNCIDAVSYTHLRAHETVLDIVCRLLLENKKKDSVHNLLFIYK